MEAPETPYPAAETVCAHEYCARPAWLSCPDGFCLFHSPYNGRLDAAARIVWETARGMAQAGDCDFRRWHFPPDPDLDLEEQQGGFFGATFSGDADFDRATFDGDTEFGGATFSGKAWFDDATFSEDAGFDGATFSGNARFDRATFSGNAWFRGATVSRLASFMRATFSGGAWFDGATFSGLARFGGARFSANAGFEGATFNGDARLVGATFRADAWFMRATFSRGAWFAHATFSAYAKFEDATFERTARFDYTQFNADALFEGVHFAADAHFNSSRFAPGCNIFFNTGHPRPFRHPREGEAAYRFAKQAAQERGDYTEAGRYHYAEQCAIEDRLMHEAGVWPRLHGLVRLLFGRIVFGYGEKPWHPLLLGLVVIMAWTGLYLHLDAIGPDNPLDPVAVESHDPSVAEALYFSVVTFTTLGYGDFQPKARYRLLASAEALLGAALLATFVVCLTRKYMR